MKEKRNKTVLSDVCNLASVHIALKFNTFIVLTQEFVKGNFSYSVLVVF